MHGAFLLPFLWEDKAMLDVVVQLIRDGVVVNSNGESKATTGNETAALGKAVLGTMRLGEA